MRKRLLSTIIALLFIASLTSVAAAVDYTLYDDGVLSESMGYSYLVDPELSLQHVVNGEVVWNPAAQAALDLPATRMDVSSLTQ